MAQTDISDLNRALALEKEFELPAGSLDVLIAGRVISTSAGAEIGGEKPVLTLRMRLHRVEDEMGERGLHGKPKVESETLKFVAVGGINDPVNSSWSRWTPAATMQIMVSNPAAIGKLTRGEEFIVDIREAPGRISSR